MFEGGLIRNKFYSKCKSAIKLTKTRIEMIMRKRNAMQKHLKNDIAELLRNGLDINAYDRTEGLLRDLNKSACYDLIDQFCECVLNQLSRMKKERECPEECREAVQSLIVAAARFADLPELRELRTLFEGRYGNSLAAYGNQEFDEKLKATCPTKDMKLQLLQDIALESGLQWDSKALGQKLYRPPAFKEAQDCKSHNDEDESIQENIDPDQIKKSNSKRNVEEKANGEKPFYYRFVPPPYTNQNTDKTETNLKVPNCVAIDHDNYRQNESVGEEDKPIPRSVRRRGLKPQLHIDSGGSTSGDAGKMNSTHELGSEPNLKILINRDGQDQQQGEEERIMHDNTQPALPSPFQPDTGHVHPKLPDYEEFVARLSSSKGKQLT